jgi:hypothetical protein
MNVREIVTALDAEIARLQYVRAVLADGSAMAKRRFFSLEARAKIATAQRKRWAKAKKGKS